MHQRTARQLILFVAGVYIVLIGLTELGRIGALLTRLTADELTRSLTTLASLTVGTVLGYYLASRQRQS